VNKSELIDMIADESDVSKAAASRALDAMINGVTQSLLNGDQVTLVGLQPGAEIVVYGMDGRECKRQMVRLGMRAELLNVSDLPAGTYVVRCGEGAAQQLVIHR